MTEIKITAEILKKADNILVISHISPDGDTLGCATALIRALRKLGKKANFACADKVDEKFLYMFDGLENQEFEPSFYVSVDIASKQLMGRYSDAFEIDVCVDHHRTNDLVAKSKYLDHKAASCTIIVYEIIKELGVDICSKIADSLYTGIATDTGCFRYTNATSRTHKVAAKLIEYGANFGEINRVMFETKTIACLKVEQSVLSKMEFYADGKILLASIPRSILEETGAKESDLESIPSLVKGIEGVYIGITLKEKEDGMWKASVRSVNPVDASLICAELGGGGHRYASGCAIDNNYESSKEKLLSACLKHLKEYDI